MARNIFNQPPKDEASSTSPSPTLPRAAKLPGSVGGLRDSLREITANSIRDIDPEQIDVDGLRDRLALEDSSIDELAASIREHGQQVPIMVRPSDKADRYNIVYGRRRLAAIRKIGGTIKAIVRTLDDDASLIAQGQENNLRLDPSFIEKSLFINEMQSSGYRPKVIQDALGLTRQGVSNHRVVLEQLPADLVSLIGPAHGIGRRQWADLAALGKKVDLVATAREVVGALPEGTPSPERFQAVYAACTRKVRATKAPTPARRTSVVTAPEGGPLGTLTVDDKALAIKVPRKDNPDFARWFEDHAEASLQQIFEQWRKESDAGS